MNRKHAMRLACLVVLALIMPCAIPSSPAELLLLKGEGWVEGLRHQRSGYGMWDIAYGTAQVHAAEPALLRASIAQPGPVLVGEHVTLIVELLTVTTFASAPIFELPNIPAAILMQLEARPILGTEDIDGETYTMQRHELALFVMRPSVVQIPPFTVRFDPPRVSAKNRLSIARARQPYRSRPVCHRVQRISLV